MKKLFTFSLVMGAVLSSQALANPFYVPPTDVPEIDALAGLGALATLGAGVALFWERRRRR
ncbi:VPEID-CTERM sorting domain-containing protein [Sulfitobacter aestuarii]|uniref:VPEID-CTERM sorting domain-containing protein n=1 Tax=Sulfitobacter aestuarii TaxID=2161676 RepID=A0ABW5U9D4_9RHOB